MFPPQQPGQPTRSPEEALASLFGGQNGAGLGGAGGAPDPMAALMGGGPPGAPGGDGMAGTIADPYAGQPADASGLLQLLGVVQPDQLLALESILSGGGTGAPPMGQSYPPSPADMLGQGPAMGADQTLGIPGLGAAGQMPPGSIPPMPGMAPPPMSGMPPGPGMAPMGGPPGMPGMPPPRRR